MKGNKSSQAHHITVVINTKNEELNIVGCIQSAQKITDDILVVDMKSTDKTVELARKNGAHVVSVKDYDYVEPARNSGLKKAKGPWILVLDADERVPASLARFLVKIALTEKHSVCAIPRKNIILGEWIQHTGWWPDRVVRFFKKGHVSWGNTIHAAPIITSPVYDLPAKSTYALHHYNMSNMTDIVERISRYAQHEPPSRIEGMTTVPDIARIIDEDFWWRFSSMEGYKDGIHGYVLSECMRFYRFLMFAFSWERGGYRDLQGADELYLARESKCVLEQETDCPDDAVVRLYKRIKNHVRRVLS